MRQRAAGVECIREEGMPQASAKKACYAAGVECVGEEGVGNGLLSACSHVTARCAAAANAFGREIRLVRIINARKDGEERANRDDL